MDKTQETISGIKGEYFLQLEKIKKAEEEAKKRTLEKLKRENKTYSSNITEHQDPPIPSQKYALVSFINPRTILPSREIFLFHKFIDRWSMKKSMDKFDIFLQYLAHTYNLDHNEILEEYENFVNNNISTFTNDDISEDFTNFLETHGEKFNKEFDQQNQFRSSVSCFMIRGSYETEEECKKHAQQLIKMDNRFDIETIPIGRFIAYDPYKKGEIEYADEQLNEIFKKKKDNEEQAKIMFNKRVLEAKTKAIEENAKKAIQSGTKLTQFIDEDGNLTGGLKSLNLNDRTTAKSELERNLENLNR